MLCVSAFDVGHYSSEYILLFLNIQLNNLRKEEIEKKNGFIAAKYFANLTTLATMLNFVLFISFLSIKCINLKKMGLYHSSVFVCEAGRSLVM